MERQQNELYLNWLADNGYEDTEEHLEQWFETHCQFCGCSTEYGPCTCDCQLRY